MVAKLTKKIDLKKELELAHFNLDLHNVDWLSLRDPFQSYKKVEDYRDFIKIIRDPANFYFTLRYVFNVDADVIFQTVILQELWNRPYPLMVGSRGMSKSFLLGLYALLRAVITQGSKVVIVSASFRQSKNVFEYAENIFNNAPVLKDLCEGYRIIHGTDMYSFFIGDSVIRAIPLGNSGDKIRGLRATHLLVDERQDIAEEVFEVVIGGFGSVNISPAESVKKMAKVNLLKKKELWTPQHEKILKQSDRPNQTVLSGTGSWAFKDFARVWKRWKSIIESRGDHSKIVDAIGGEPESTFDWKDFSIIRIPYELIPEGFMDAKHIGKQKSTVHISRFQMEYGAIFPADSDGFFKRTLVESCVTKHPIDLPSGAIQFRATVFGDPYKKYIYGIDPASESDNFAIVILEKNLDHTRVVYCWTTTRKKLIKDKTKKENDFYQYAARKIRNLMKVFPCEYIALDSQGGGIGVMEALHNFSSLREGELPIWPIQAEDPLKSFYAKDYGYDDEAGLHIIEMVGFSSSDYTTEANHGLKKDLQDKVLLFPFIDALEIGLAELEDGEGLLEDSVRNCVFEIEELKEELSTIQHTTSQTGRDRWDTPETVLPGNKKGRLRKDRYSALLMANMAARRLDRPTTISHQKKPAGGFVYDIMQNPSLNTEGRMYTGPDWFLKANTQNWGRSI